MNIFISHSVLKGYNFAALSHSSTFELLRIIDNLLYDVKIHKKKIWILFQNMNKAYNQVNIFMLQHAMNRLKISLPFINLITNLFTNHTNQVFIQSGITDSYKVLVGIDQEEVICPLL